MRNLLMVILLVMIGAAGAAGGVAYAQDGPPNWDDPLPLPPPPLDEALLPTLIGPGEEPAPPASQPLPSLPAVASMPSPQPAPPVPGPEIPLPGRITGGRVNIRSGPNTQYESLGVAVTGTQVTVLARNGDWYKVLFPQDYLASIHKNYVDADIAGEIPDAGIAGVVNQDNVEVHAFYWDKSTVVGMVNKGERVLIRQERGQWYRIEPPPSARAYVFAEYVRVDGGGTVTADSSPAPLNPAVNPAGAAADGAAAGPAKLSENDKRAAALKEAYFQRQLAMERQREEAEARDADILIGALSDLEAKIRAIDQEAGARMSQSVSTTFVGGAGWSAPDPAYGGFTGWVENIGRVGSAPTNLRLVKGGEIRFYLKSSRHNLDEYAGTRVWVNGNIELASGAFANILDVSEIRLLSEAEMAGQASSTPVTADAWQDASPSYTTTVPSPPSGLPDHVGGGLYASDQAGEFPPLQTSPSYGDLPQVINTPYPFSSSQLGDSPVIVEIGP